MRRENARAEVAAAARLRMRSARRGTREMDLILGRFADAALQALPPAELDAYETILSENDQDLYQWVSGQGKVPPERTRQLSAGFGHFLAGRGSPPES